MGTPAGRLNAAARAAEHRRQTTLLAALQGEAQAWPMGWCGPAAALPSHQQHARATAARTLTVAYPVLAGQLAPADVAAAAWDLWQRHPPRQGDLGTWGRHWAGWLRSPAGRARCPTVAGWAADLARLEWAVHQASRAEDAPEGWPAGLALLHTTDPARLAMQPRPGLAVLNLSTAALALWQTWTQGDVPVAEVPVPSPAGRGRTAVVVCRRGLAVGVRPLPADQARFTRRLLRGESLGQALAQAAPNDFQAWLQTALTEGWWTAAGCLPDVDLSTHEEP